MKRKCSERGIPLKNKSKAILLFSTVLLCTIAVSLVQSKLNANKALKSTQTEEGKPKTVKKTEEEWKKILTPEQFRILRKAGTERPNGDVYYEFKKQGAGTYYCAGCDTELFSSNEKFDSRCGWPSFYDPSNAKMSKHRWIIFLAIPGPKYYVQFVMDIWGMCLPVKDSILQQISVTA